MPAYLTVPAFVDSLASAGGYGARTAVELPEDRLQHHLDQAHALVLGRLARNYDVAAPDATPPPDALLVEIIAGHAGYTATLEHDGSQDLSDRDPVVLRYAYARDLLAQVVSGSLILAGITDKSGGAATGEPAAYGQGPTVGLADDVYADPYGHTYGAHRGWGGVWL